MLTSLLYVATYWIEETVSWKNPGSSMKRMFPTEGLAKRVVKAMISSEENDKLHEGIIMSIFGYESKVKKAEFNKIMTTKCKWIFNVKGIND